jgi:hypothetical protein
MIDQSDKSIVEVFESKSKLSKKELRDFISSVQKTLESMGEQIDLPVKHHFSNGVYGREMTMPKGCLLVGKIHKKQNLCMVLKGEVSVLSVDGVVRLKAPYTYVGSPGAQRVIFAHEESIWTVLHGTHETDVDKIESEFIAKDYEDYYLSTNRSLDDVLDVLGETKEGLTQISENHSDQVDFTDAVDVEIKDSAIHGKGVFAKKDFEIGDLIAPARVGVKRTPMGRYMNHSPKPNAYVKSAGDLLNVFALKKISQGDEILSDYYFNFKNSREGLCLG